MQFPLMAIANKSHIACASMSLRQLKAVSCLLLLLVGLSVFAHPKMAQANSLSGLESAVSKGQQIPVATNPADVIPGLNKSPFTLAQQIGLSGSQFAEFLTALDSAKPLTAKRGENLADMLQRVGVDRATARDLVSSVSKNYDVRNLRAGQQVHLLMTPSAGPNKGNFMGLLIPASLERNVMVVRQPDDHFQVLDLKRPVSRNLRLATITINDSLYEDGAEAKVPANILTELVKTLSYDIDFQRDIHGGDRFDLLYEEQVNDEGRLVRNGGLQYVSYTIDGETKRIYRFNDGDRAEFYLENGEALRRSLMRTPIDGARLSSGFGMRFHPVLGYSRMHRGVDFAAPVGTPIYAAGDGTVAFAGRFSGYGNYVKIKHDSAYQTAYGHMNAFANNIRVGAKVRQGQVIGYVGRTGIATGPHLHYEIYVNSDQVNPLSVKAVGNAKLSGNKLTLFRGQQKDLARTLAELKKLPGQRLALAK